MSDHFTHQRRLLGLGSAVLLALAVVTPVLAWEGEGGTKYCTDPFLGYVHFRYFDIADVIPPGSSTQYLYRDNDNAWHARERNGIGGGGYWEVIADPDLDMPNTWPGCRNYG